MRGRRRSQPGDPLTDRQREALALVREGWRLGCPPSLREIGASMGIRSTNAVSDLLRALQAKGYLVREPGPARARVSWVPSVPHPPLDLVGLFREAERLEAAVLANGYGRAGMTQGGGDDPVNAPQWWRLVVATGGWSANEDAIAAVDPTWHALCHQATIRGGLHVWAWGPVPEHVGGDLGPITVGRW